MVKLYEFLHSVLIYDMEVLISQLMGCLVDCLDWELTFCVMLLH